MKKLIIPILLLLSVCTFAQKQRCFLIGFIAEDNESRSVFTIGFDTCMNGYPNVYGLIRHLEKTYSCKKGTVVSISEYTHTDRNQFWASKTPKPAPIPDTTKPIQPQRAGAYVDLYSKKGVQVDSVIQFRDSFPPIPDSVYFINQLQIGEVYKYVMDNMSASEFSKVSQGMEIAFRVLTQLAEDQYNKKRKPIKVPVKK
jgi:hypothetical protein